MKKQTAVQWFAQRDTELTIEFLEGKLNQIQLAIEKTKCLQQAKAMEREQIVDAFDIACSDEDRIGREYYNETYGK